MAVVARECGGLTFASAPHFCTCWGKVGTEAMSRALVPRRLQTNRKRNAGLLAQGKDIDF
eukprot:354808-Chlamydomonas_euryale.AAC.3